MSVSCTGHVATGARRQADAPRKVALQRGGGALGKRYGHHQIIDLLATLETASITSTNTMVTMMTRPAVS